MGDDATWTPTPVVGRRGPDPPPVVAFDALKPHGHLPGLNAEFAHAGRDRWKIVCDPRTLAFLAHASSPLTDASRAPQRACCTETEDGPALAGGAVRLSDYVRSITKETFALTR
jgi:hypothetical protein